MSHLNVIYQTTSEMIVTIIRNDGEEFLQATRECRRAANHCMCEWLSHASAKD